MMNIFYMLSVTLGRIITQFYYIFTGNIKFEKNVCIDPKTTITVARNASVYIMSNTYLRSLSRGYHAGMPFSTTLLADMDGASIEIGSNCRINGAYIHAKKKIVIGNNCVVASGVHIIDSNGHEIYSTNRTIGRDIPKSIVIGNNVWIGLNCIILKGTIIGDNCIVSAGSVVKGQFEENCIIEGNPAKQIKTLIL